MAHEILTPEQRAAVLAGTVEQRLMALGCPAGLAKRAQQLFEKRSATPSKAVEKPTTPAPLTDYERQRKAAAIAIQVAIDRAAGHID